MGNTDQEPFAVARGSETPAVGEETACPSCGCKCRTWVKERLNRRYIMRGYDCKNCSRREKVCRAESPNGELCGGEAEHRLTPDK